jgi:glycosyltransferase involved in cell wall biosynthesis
MNTMKICFALLYCPPLAHSMHPRAYLERVVLQLELPRALAARGHVVHMVHAFPYTAELEDLGVQHHFIAAGHFARALGTLATWLGRDRAMFELAWHAAQCIRRLEPDVVHFHGLILTWNLGLLQLVLGKQPPMVLHYHGGYPPSNPLIRSILTACFARTSRQLFTTRSHAHPFLYTNMLTNPDSVVELLETSSNFQPIPKELARKQTSIYGNPAIVVAGRLHPLKDPLTVLHAFALIAPQRPAARLYFYYLTNELEGELRQYIASQPLLTERVVFGGRAPFEQMPAIYSSADIIVQASLREFSGCAILEAMACGAVPVISDIPSFRRMTDNGRFGALFPVGDEQVLAQQLLTFDPATITEQSARVRQYFVESLSFTAMAAQLEQLYQQIVITDVTQTE